MYNILQANMDIFFTIHFDDILIFSQFTTAHKQHLHWVLWQLKTTGLHAKAKNYIFALIKLKYLGHIVPKDRLKADPHNANKFRNGHRLPALESFSLLLADYYSKFLPSFDKIVASLYKLLHKDIEWIWSSKHTAAINALQKALSYQPVLCLLYFQKAFPLDTNAFDFVISGVLS